MCSQPFCDCNDEDGTFVANDLVTAFRSGEFAMANKVLLIKIL